MFVRSGTVGQQGPLHLRKRGSMRYLPINLDIRTRPVVVVGGGEIAGRKVLRLLESGALVTVVAPQLTEELRQLAQNGRIRHLKRDYAAGDLNGAFLAIAATSGSAVNRAVAAEAHGSSILIDRVDEPEMSSFTMPAVITRDDLVITVSTSGKSPALARKIRAELERVFGEEYGATLRLLGALREKLLTEKGNSAYNKTLFSELVAHDLPKLIKEHRHDELDHLLLELFGPGFTTHDLLGEEKDHQ
jgi:precorrin-2 dehydrogenase/sirohydrochlorin ferrochelatase